VTRVRIAPPDTEEDVSAERLLESAVAAGRYVHVTTYHDGATPIRASLLFKTAADAAICARALSAIARAEQRHPSAVLDDIVGPARAASVGVRCAAHGPWADEFPCGDTLDKCNGDNAARGAGESEEQKR